MLGGPGEFDEYCGLKHLTSPTSIPFAWYQDSGYFQVFRVALDLVTTCSEVQSRCFMSNAPKEPMDPMDILFRHLSQALLRVNFEPKPGRENFAYHTLTALNHVT
eukprot:s4588_g3.t1